MNSLQIAIATISLLSVIGLALALHMRELYLASLFAAVLLLVAVTHDEWSKSPGSVRAAEKTCAVFSTLPALARQKPSGMRLYKPTSWSTSRA
jgi:cytochrome c oxidase assembly factor CtaG